jgi:hypothetical protein
MTSEPLPYLTVNLEATQAQQMTSEPLPYLTVNLEATEEAKEEYTMDVSAIDHINIRLSLLTSKVDALGRVVFRSTNKPTSYLLAGVCAVGVGIGVGIGVYSALCRCRVVCDTEDWGYGNIRHIYSIKLTSNK